MNISTESQLDRVLNDRHLPDDINKCIVLNEKICLWKEVSLR